MVISRCTPVRIAAAMFGLSVGVAVGLAAQQPAPIRNARGMQLLVKGENAQPTLRVVLPDRPVTDSSIEILFPEHVTATRRGSAGPEHLYMFRPGPGGERPAWRSDGRSLEYERNLPGKVHMLARATLDNDGVRIRYEFGNRSTVAYDMIQAVTDPRLTSLFHDVRLERTWVHHPSGFELLASETPSRLTMPLERWLPARYLASHTWPVPARRIERRSDGITYYNKSRAVDLPLIATVSSDGAWIVASFARQAGNVWTNPALTCQHVDPQATLAPGEKAVLEVKILVLHGSMVEVLQRVLLQRRTLR